MKRKFILYPAVALALMTSASLSSCVDTDEPESLENLRNAVAQEVQANATLLNAKADVEKAYVAVVNANAKAAELQNAYQEYVNAAKAASSAAEIANSKKEEAQTDAETASLVEKAKLDAEAKAVKAKQDLEDAQEAYQANVKKLEVDLLEAQLKYKVQLAQDNAEGLTDLREALTKWNKAQKAVVEAEEELADVYVKAAKNKERYELENEVAKKTKALQEKEDALKKITDDFATYGTEAFAKLWKDYQAKVDGAQAKSDSLTGVVTRLGEDLKLLTKAETEAKTALDAKTKPISDALDKAVTDAQNAVTGLENTIKKAADVAVACSNTVLADLVSTEDLTYKTHDKDGNEVSGQFDLKNGKFVASTDVRANDAAAVAKNIKAAFDKYSADQLLQNRKMYEAVAEKIKSELNERLNDLGKDDKSGERKTWVEYTKAYNTAVSKNDKSAFETAEANLLGQALVVFGEYADDTKTFTVGEKTVKGNAGYFVGVALTDDIPALLVKAGLAESVEKIEWNRLGVYGAWKKLAISLGDGGTNAYMRTIMADATTASAAVQAIVDTYTNAKKAADDKLTAAKNAKNSTKVEESESVKAEKEAYDKAKAAREDKDKEIKKVNAELAPIADQKAYDKVMADYYGELVSKAGATITSAAAYDTYMKFATDEAEYAVTKAKAELAKAEQDLANYDAGKYAAEADIEAAENKVKAKVEAEAEAKAEYEKLKGYYGIN